MKSLIRIILSCAHSSNFETNVRVPEALFPATPYQKVPETLKFSVRPE